MQSEPGSPSTPKKRKLGRPVVLPKLRPKENKAIRTKPPAIGTYLGIELQSLMKRHSISFGKAARVARLWKSHIIRVVHGQAATMSNEDFAKLTENLTAEMPLEEGARLVRARLLDHKTGRGSEIVDIVIRSDQAEVELPIPEEAERALNFLRVKIASGELDPAVFIQLAELAGLKHAPKTKGLPVANKADPNPAA